MALLSVLALIAGAGLVAGRELVLDERAHGSADAVALAAARVLEARYGEGVDAGSAPATLRATERLRGRRRLARRPSSASRSCR